jgi:hypothetical protein
MPKCSTSSIVIGIVYVAFVGILVTASSVARQRVLATESTPSSQADWEDWRAEAERQHKGDGPVTRRVPKIAEPPSLILLRDHFATSLVVLVVLSSALYFALALMVRGALVGPRFVPDLEDHELAGNR